MSRLAWFTPLPPTRSGIAQYNRELLPFLADAHDIDVFVDGRAGENAAPDRRVAVYDAHDFLWKYARHPYDLVVYQLGNAPCHDYMWAYLTRYPGLVVLHDGQLHHARGRTLLQQWHPRKEDYRREFWFNHPDANRDLAELGAEGLLGSLTYLWPMLRIVVESSRAVLVHNEWQAEQIRDAHRDTPVHVVNMGVPQAAPAADARRRMRARHGIPDEAVVFTAFGKATPEKRVREATRALASMAYAVPHAHLLVAGETVEYYNIEEEAAALGIAGRVTVAGYVADAEIDDYLEASDVCLCMRWPTSRETSASWLRCLAAGKPTISTDLVHTTDVPTLDPRDWSVLAGLKASATNKVKAGATNEVKAGATNEVKAGATNEVKAGATNEVKAGATNEKDETAKPVGVSIDILDEDHSLKLALRRLATDEKLRATLGSNGRTLWAQRFRLEQMAAGYQETIVRVLQTKSNGPGIRRILPPHLRSSGTEHADALVKEIMGSEYHLRDAD